MKPEKVVKWIAFGCTLAGAAISLVSDWCSKKEMDATITKKVTEAVKEELKKA